MERPADIGHRVLIVEDHVSLREALAAMVEREADFGPVTQAGSIAEARKVIGRMDVALVDLRLPDGEGTGLIRELLDSHSGEGTCAVLVLTASLDRLEWARAVGAGASGVLHKSEGVEEIIAAIRRLCEGEVLISVEEVVELLRHVVDRGEREMAARLAAESLTRREREILQAIADGLDGREIARRLGVSVETERNYMAAILAKLRVHSRLQALVFALRHGLVEARFHDRCQGR